MKILMVWSGEVEENLQGAVAYCGKSKKRRRPWVGFFNV
jgi:hypothetical protein